MNGSKKSKITELEEKLESMNQILQTTVIINSILMRKNLVTPGEITDEFRRLRKQRGNTNTFINLPTESPKSDPVQPEDEPSDEDSSGSG